MAKILITDAIQGQMDLTDAEILDMAYAISYYEYHGPADGYDYLQGLKARLRALEAQKMRRQAQPIATATVTKRCRMCGAPATMTASLGPACPEHYDALSA